MEELHGRVALVTGGSRGIGRAVVTSLSSRGYAVAFTYLMNSNAADAVIAETGKSPILSIRSDARDPDSVRSTVDKVLDVWGRVDILVNNAGIVRDRALSLMTDEEWNDVVTTTLYGTFYYIRAIVPTMMRRGFGRIVNISSIGGLNGVAGQTNYVAAKAGIIGLTKAAAKELTAFGITVNAVAPGYIDTDMLSGIPEATKARLRTSSPLGRFGTPCEVAELVAFIVSDSSSHITGQIIGIGN